MCVFVLYFFVFGFVLLIRYVFSFFFVLSFFSIVFVTKTTHFWCFWVWSFPFRTFFNFPLLNLNFSTLNFSTFHFELTAFEVTPTLHEK